MVALRHCTLCWFLPKRWQSGDQWGSYRDIMITEYQCTTSYIIRVYGESFTQTHVHWSHFCKEMAQNADLPIKVAKKLSVVTPPKLGPVLGDTASHRAVLFPDSCCCGSHNFQIVPARLTCTSKTVNLCINKTVRQYIKTVYKTVYYI